MYIDNKAEELLKNCKGLTLPTVNSQRRRSCIVGESLDGSRSPHQIAEECVVDGGDGRILVKRKGEWNAA